ncbi:hypothetical protein ACJJIF_15880 [Microbulbifer sp. SSSA002]|uniref:hypothetical protein n=1 Tax=Microbulbifer sp. SSSA002 TaxID=3243376 RepID=UPI00403A3ACF
MIARAPRLLILLFTLMFFKPVFASQGAEEAFNKIKALSGEWREEGEKNNDFIINFSEIAGGSVLIESWIHKGRQHSLTVYHLDGDDLLVTHYCPQGNQPRLSWQKNTTGEAIEFSFKDITNFASGSRLDSLAFAWLGNGRLQRQETYVKNGEQIASDLILVRQ